MSTARFDSEQYPFLMMTRVKMYCCKCSNSEIDPFRLFTDTMLFSAGCEWYVCRVEFSCGNLVVPLF